MEINPECQKTRASSKNEILYSIVVPVYNEEGNLDELYTRLTSVMEGLGSSYEIIFIDDGSSDSSLNILKKIYEKDQRVKIIKFIRNFGQHPAMMAGFRHASGEIIVTIDSDLQHPPEDLPKLIEKISLGYDIVCGKRIKRSDSIFRKVTSKITNKLISKLIGVPISDFGCNFRIYRRDIINHIKSFKEKSYYLTVLTSWIGKRIAEVEISTENRRYEKSKYNIFSLARLFFNIVTGFSTIPLRAISFIGVIMSLFGILAGILLIIVRYTTKDYISDLSVLIAILFILFGIQLFGLGMVGEYIGRIYIETKNRPDYIIEEIIQEREE